MFNLPSPKTTKNRKRVGRGGVHGRHTAGKGQKGQKSRSGYKSPRPGFEGGQMPLSRRIPKLKGFRRASFLVKENRVILNLSDLSRLYKDGEQVDIETLVEKGMPLKVNKVNKVKILGNGDLKIKLSIMDLEVSKSAQDKIVKAGGSVQIG
jgi:large subunit ribosomal protein L15